MLVLVDGINLEMASRVSRFERKGPHQHGMCVTESKRMKRDNKGKDEKVELGNVDLPILCGSTAYSALVFVLILGQIRVDLTMLVNLICIIALFG